MSTIQLPRAVARSAYRDLYRAASSTFRGDGTVLKAFRQKMRQDAMVGQEIADLGHYEQQVQLARDIAVVLRNNIVQGVKVTERSHPGIETWRLTMRPETELGSNDSIKNPPATDSPSSRSAKKRERAANSGTLPGPRVPIYYSALKRAHKERRVPILVEEDIEETFVRGTCRQGAARYADCFILEVVRHLFKGGQSINKTENNVQLLHRPTGIRVTCQETRSLSTNRKLARRLLVERLDRLENPGLTKKDVDRARQRERERRRRKKAKKKELQEIDV